MTSYYLLPSSKKTLQPHDVIVSSSPASMCETNDDEEQVRRDGYVRPSL